MIGAKALVVGALAVGAVLVVSAILVAMAPYIAAAIVAITVWVYAIHHSKPKTPITTIDMYKEKE